jgi:pimeloyl-ACP methyl ester carboxylesterase
MPRDGLAAEGFLEIGAHRLEYRWIDARTLGLPTLVFLHEGLGSVGIWRDFPDKVAAETGCGALIYSRAGYGKSSAVPLPRPLTYQNVEGYEVLPAILDALDLQRVVLIGHSDGATISIIHAGSGAAHRVAGLILEAPHVFNEELSVTSIAAAKVAYDTGDLRARLQRLHGDNVDVAFRGWNDVWLHPGYRNWNIEASLPGITVPSLVIQGKDDEYGSAGQYEAILAKSGGRVDLLVLGDCKHTPHRDRADTVLRAMADFIREIS